MKKLYSLILMSLCTFGFVACGDDTENPYAVPTTVTVTSSDILFPAAASQGSIQFEATGAVTATSNVSWCHVAVNGNTVNVEVDQNNTRNGRSAQITLASGEGSVICTVQQSGVIFEVNEGTPLSVGDAAASYTYYVQHNLDAAFESDVDWATVEKTAEDSVKVTFSENTTGHPRMGYIKYRSGEMVDSVKVLQADFDTDIAGSYRLYYQNGKDETKSLAVKLTATQLQLTAYRLNIPITYDAANGIINIQAGQYVGRYSGSYIYLAFGTRDGQYWSAYYTTTYCTANLTYSAEDGIIAKIGGTLGTSEIGSFLFTKMKAQSFEEANNDGTLLTLFEPYLQRAN